MTAPDDVALRAAGPTDVPALLAGRDEEWARWLGPGADEPRPTACILVGGEVAGWVDAEVGHDWLRAGEVNVGYSVFAPHRRRGVATRAVDLLVGQLAAEGVHRTAVLLIHPGNEASRGVARRARFVRDGAVGDELRFVRPIGSGRPPG
jgi:RimJ/RimL family protein N-acetyltransferase